MGLDKNYFNGTIPAAIENAIGHGLNEFYIATNCFTQPFDDVLVKACTNAKCTLYPQQVPGYC
jgi:hypothetical protein